MVNSSSAELEFRTDKPADRFLLELIAKASICGVYCNGYRVNVLRHIYPDIYRSIYQNSSEDLPDLVPETKSDLDKEIARRHLTGYLVLLLHLGAQEFGINRDQELSGNQINMLSTFFETAWEDSRTRIDDLVEVNPKIEKLRNPLADPAIIKSIWAWNRSKKPLGLDELISFDETAQST